MARLFHIVAFVQIMLALVAVVPYHMFVLVLIHNTFVSFKNNWAFLHWTELKKVHSASVIRFPTTCLSSRS